MFTIRRGSQPGERGKRKFVVVVADTPESALMWYCQTAVIDRATTIATASTTASCVIGYV